MKKIDERDTMFSRMNLDQNSPEFEDYYKRRPELKEIDEELRKLPQLGSEEGKVYDELNSPIVDASFGFLNDIKPFAEGVKSENRVEVDPEIITNKLKGLAKYYGAKLVGVTEIKENHFYSHRGRSKETYGNPIEITDKYAIVFALEMEPEMVFKAPLVPEAVAVTKGYVNAAVTGMVLSYYIRELGYDARNHMDGNYLVIAPLVARDAGIGEIGRTGLLTTKEYGPRVRLGVVTTNMPLIADKETSYGIKELCDICGNCFKNCPVKAIPEGEQKEENGQKKWKVNHENCYSQWRKLGTDCGVCIASCPLSSPVRKELLDKMKESEEAREAILEDYFKKNKARAHNKEKIDWLDNK